MFVALLESAHAAPANPPTFSKKVVKAGLVPGFPRWPAYPGAVLESSYQKTEDNRIGHEATWKTSDTITQVITWYIKTLPGQGWTIQKYPEDTSAGEQTLLATQGPLKAALVLDQEDDNKTEITVEFPLRDQTP